MSTPMDFDFTRLEQDIEEAARKAFLEVVDGAGDETIEAFALYSDDGAMTVCPATNTLEHVQEQDAKRPGNPAYYRFTTAEWKYEAEGADDPFSAICDTVRNEVLEKETDEEWFEAFKTKLYESCVSVLVKLKREEFFKNALGRDVFLLFAVSEVEFSKAELFRLNDRLNSGPVAKEFVEWVESWAPDE